MSGSHLSTFIFVFVSGVVFVAGCAEDCRSGDLRNKKIVISMPPVKTTHADQYICYAQSLEEIEDSFLSTIQVIQSCPVMKPIYKGRSRVMEDRKNGGRLRVSSVTKADNCLVHHVALGVCGQPASSATTWDCTQHQGDVCIGDAINFGGWEEFTKNNGKFDFPKDVSLRVGTKTRLKYFILQIHFSTPIKNGTVSAANVTLECIHHPTKFNYQTYAFLINGLIPENSGKGVLVEGYLIRNDSWTLIGSQQPVGKQKDYYYVPGGPVEIRTGDIVAARCLYIIADQKPVKFGMSEGEEMCNFLVDLGYDPQYDEQFRRPPVCRAISPDFRFCDFPETNQLC